MGDKAAGSELHRGRCYREVDSKNVTKRTKTLIRSEKDGNIFRPQSKVPTDNILNVIDGFVIWVSDGNFRVKEIRNYIDDLFPSASSCPD
ncbi:hypothetical protein Tco_0673846 [Tanacetum coccineum]